MDGTLSTNQKGAIAETGILHIATKLGIEVYVPAIEHGRYDMIFDLQGQLWRVQCKWGKLKGEVVSAHTQSSRRTADGFLARSYTEEEIDAIAVYCCDLDRCFFLPISLVAGRRMIHLRLGPARNNQRAGINWAQDYDLGAIAQLGERLLAARGRRFEPD